MTRPGRLLREVMRPDLPGAAAERIRHRAIAEQAIRERETKWPVLTSENAAAAIAWQTARIVELEARANAQAMTLELHVFNLRGAKPHWIRKGTGRSLCGRAIPDRPGNHRGGLDPAKYADVVCRRCSLLAARLFSRSPTTRLFP